MNATLSLIATDGIEQVTIRKIAALAGSNVALINYYFGSKEKLIGEAIKVQFDSFREAFSALENREVDSLTRLKSFLLQILSSLQEHPELMKRLVGQGQESMSESQAEYVSFFKTKGFEQIRATLEEITGETNAKVTSAMMQQIFAAIFSPAFRSACARKQAGADDDREFLTNVSVEEQVDLFFNHYFYRYLA
ncbi:TetR/AcrR family transcriptional regulator [Cohnella faecalis]|uniref:TetR/AcrR family transcriptional regulator n=1 Tax=Cohnella faecalis TaxID=2315694 RepID=UPI002277488F|nr:TetR family transcriptional regulator [Cohnella faecalis]